jgi:8-oxo-dGTP pyrophosphatase MutT (NUDIX family)
MAAERPVPIDELSGDAGAGPPATPRQAATVILLREGDEALEVLLVQRNRAQRFMGGAWVFPGGAVDAHEGEGDLAHRLAGVREVREEVEVELGGPASLVRFSRWITPEEVRIRFDTHFFLALAPAGAAARVDGDECVDLRWVTPREGIDAAASGDMLLFFPTLKHLEQIEPFGSARELIEWAQRQDVRPVLPRVVHEGETARIVLPGEPGYGG